MKLEESLQRLSELGSEKVRVRNKQHGAGDNQYGVKLGDIGKLAKEVKSDHRLAMALWETGNIDGQLLAVLLMKPKQLSPEELDRLVRSVDFEQVADWLNSYVVKRHPDKESLRQRWLADKDSMAARAGWNLTAERVAKNPEDLDISKLLHRIESEMGSAAPVVQWTMNAALVEIGINFTEHRERAIAIGEKLGVFRDYPVSRGCTSPFAPEWINAMVS